jgi:hypothetical protein
LFPTLKKFFGGRHFRNEEELKHAFKEKLNGLVAEVYDEDVQELITYL